MAPYTGIPLSPAELSYLHASLQQTPPIRPDGRSQNDFRSLTAEADILPTANGSARVCFADGTEAIVGVKAEVEKSKSTSGKSTVSVEQGVDQEETSAPRQTHGEEDWLEVAVEIPSTRDDDPLPVFLAAMLSEALLADGTLKDRLYINSRFHWRLYVDILLLSTPLSYPLPLLSLTSHLALLSTRLPALASQGDEDPLFSDDWAAATPLYPQSTLTKPPITLLLMSVGDNIFYDPSREELAVADAVFAISVAQQHSNKALEVVSMRTIDPPSRLTAAGVPRDLTSGGAVSVSTAEALVRRELDEVGKVWKPPRGGLKRALMARMISQVVKDGVAADVLEALAKVNI
ncbi:hypothetical protein AMS68_007448 [Peltaster fructicola]|uniref:Ribosomal RNA-processing protein 42 n=1 Tax=Peltaster fructicola TaxID=286661 RepID=A0A6H0Y4T7_9PEZI|nr:hypothetical protein AMS68_007448 [Peltaster fructicola]